MFLETENEMGRFFGLSLVRDWMQCELAQSVSAPTISTAREQIRRTMMSWLNELLQQITKSATTNIASSVPYYLLSNAVSVVTLSIKFDFPAFWPTAFTELLQLGYTYGIPGIDLVVRVMKELEVEVVMFSESRSKAEIAQNTVVKDAMRESTIVREIVSFLCQSTQHTLAAQRADICSACLHSLAELIAWIDISLVVQEALPVIYQLWQCPEPTIRAAVAFCFYELVKKGMDPVVKVRLLHSIGLVPRLTQDERIQSLLKSAHSSEAEVRELEQVSTLVDIIVLELLGCWCKYEDIVCGKGKASSPSVNMSGGAGDSESAELLAAIPTVVSFLGGLVPLLLDFFTHSSLKVSCNTLPSCTRLVAILKQQQGRAQALDQLANAANNSAAAGGNSANGSAATTSGVFRAEDYLNALLSGVYSKSQYPLHFDFDAALEDELDEEVEVGRETDCLCCVIMCVTWLFVYTSIFVWHILRLFATGMQRC